MGHEEALIKLGLLDIEQASKVAGSRFFYMKGDLALLEQALIQFAIKELTKKGYTLVAPPMMMKREYYKGVTSMGDFQEMLYKAGESKEAEGGKDTEHMDEELFMIATSEHPIAALHANQIFSKKDLPKKYIGFSPCFRREAGAPERTRKGSSGSTNSTRLSSSYSLRTTHGSCSTSSSRTQRISTGSSRYRTAWSTYAPAISEALQQRSTNLEAYMPVQGKYREMVSCSNCTEWQAMRLDIKYDEGAERKYVHTLNSTAIATNRTIVAIVENYLNDDGTITVPDALVPYLGKNKLG